MLTCVFCVRVSVSGGGGGFAAKSSSCVIVMKLASPVEQPTDSKMCAKTTILCFVCVRAHN